MKWFLYVGLALIFVTGLLSGGWTTADQQRANFYMQSAEERQLKDKWSTWTGLAGALFLGIAALLYYW